MSCQVFCLILFCICLYSSFKRWRARKTNEDFLGFFLYIIWILCASLQIAYIYSYSRVYIDCIKEGCSDNNRKIILFYNFFTYLAEFLLALLATLTFNHIHDSSRLLRIISYATLVGMVLACALPQIISDVLYVILFNIEDSVADPRAYLLNPGSFLEAWRSARYIWVAYWFVLSLLPMNYAFFIIARKGPTEKMTFGMTLRKMYQLDKSRKIMVLNILQIFVVVFYYVLSYLVDYTLLLQNDRSNLSAKRIQFSLIAVHSILNYLLAEQVKKVLRNVVALGKGRGSSAVPDISPSEPIKLVKLVPAVRIKNEIKHDIHLADTRLLDTPT